MYVERKQLNNSIHIYFFILNKANPQMTDAWKIMLQCVCCIAQIPVHMGIKKMKAQVQYKTSPS